jgi:hypothetical protein
MELNITTTVQFQARNRSAPLKCSCGGDLVLEDYSRNGWIMEEGARRPKYVEPRREYSCSKAPKCKELVVMSGHKETA